MRVAKAVARLLLALPALLTLGCVLAVVGALVGIAFAIGFLCVLVREAR